MDWTSICAIIIVSIIVILFLLACAFTGSKLGDATNFLVSKEKERKQQIKKSKAKKIKPKKIN